MTLSQHLREARLKLAGLPSGHLEAEVLLAHALDAPRSFLFANPELELPLPRLNRFRQLVNERLNGQPVAYLTGKREFWSLPLQVNPDVLIPRHETELLVETALEHIPVDADWRIVDLGTGSGAIALAVASERPGCHITATDVSPEALDLARTNAANLGFANIEFRPGSWCSPLSGKYQVIISNPPYVAADDPHLVNGDCRFEPDVALTPGIDGLLAIRLITSQAPQYLQDGGWLMFEHGHDQGPAVVKILQQAGFKHARCITDVSGQDRISIGQLPGKS